jgi:hypothetical protein
MYLSSPGVGDSLGMLDPRSSFPVEKSGYHLPVGAPRLQKDRGAAEDETLGEFPSLVFDSKVFFI